MVRHVRLASLIIMLIVGSRAFAIKKGGELLTDEWRTRYFIGYQPVSLSFEYRVESNMTSSRRHVAAMAIPEDRVESEIYYTLMASRPDVLRPLKVVNLKVMPKEILSISKSTFERKKLTEQRFEVSGDSYFLFSRFIPEQVLKDIDYLTEVKWIKAQLFRGETMVDKISLRATPETMQLFKNGQTQVDPDIGFSLSPFADTVRRIRLKEKSKPFHERLLGRDSLRVRLMIDEGGVNIQSYAWINEKNLIALLNFTQESYCEYVWGGS